MVLCSLTGGRGRQSGVHHAGSMMGNDPINTGDNDSPATIILKKWPDALKKDDAAPSKNDSSANENNDVQSQTTKPLLQAASPEELDKLLHGRIIPREPFREISQEEEEEEEVSSSEEEE